jgi:S1-C subfamily serine protease
VANREDGATPEKTSQAFRSPATRVTDDLVCAVALRDDWEVSPNTRAAERILSTYVLRFVLLLPLLCVAAPCKASRWMDIGNAGVSTDKVLVDADSIESVDNFRLANLMTLSSAPHTNAHNITYDRRVNRVAFNCAERTFQSVKMLAYLGDKQVGSGPENTEWRTTMKSVGTDPLNNRALAIVCGSPGAGAAPAAQKPKAVSGSGIVIDSVGDILTANHVVGHCKSITVRTASSKAFDASVFGVDPKSDLAILKIAYDAPLGEPARFRVQSKPARLGETIGVIGYPLTGILSTEPKATFGQVNSVAGINNDYTLLQISAPVQPGNSGGPALDESGQVIGVVVGTAPMTVLALTGNIPQNVNFAVRGEVAQIFMAARGIKVLTGHRQQVQSTEAIAAEGLKSTVLVLCAIE